MNHDLLYLFKRGERTRRANKFSLLSIVFSLLLIMNGYYANLDQGLKEVQTVFNQKTTDDLDKLTKNDDEVVKLIGNLNEV